jgi:hypothetical protein
MCRRQDTERSNRIAFFVRLGGPVQWSCKPSDSHPTSYSPVFFETLDCPTITRLSLVPEVTELVPTYTPLLQF